MIQLRSIRLTFQAMTRYFTPQEIDGGKSGVANSESKLWAHALKAEAFALYLAARHPNTPWNAKLLVAAIVAYAFSPIDLIPDFIPIVGYLDDLVLVPIGIALAIRIVPHGVLAECRAQARDVMANGKPSSQIAGAIVVTIWLASAALCGVWAYEILENQGTHKFKP